MYTDKHETQNYSDGGGGDDDDNDDRNSNNDLKSQLMLLRSMSHYPVKFSNYKENKVYLSLNSTNKIEAMIQDCQIGEVYDQIKFLLEDDMRFFGSIILNMMNRYVSEYAGRAKASNHHGHIQETFDILKDFKDNLEFYKDIWIPYHIKDMNPNKQQGQPILVESVISENNIKKE